MKTPITLLAVVLAAASLCPGRALGQNDVYDTPPIYAATQAPIKAYVNVPTLEIYDRPNEKPTKRKLHPPATVLLYVQPRSNQDARRYADPANAGWKWVEYLSPQQHFLAGWVRRRDLVLVSDSATATFAGPEHEGAGEPDRSLSAASRQRKQEEAAQAAQRYEQQMRLDRLMRQLEKQSIPVDSATGTVTYAGVGVVAGATSDELYTRARLWFAATFKSSKSVIEVDDKAAGIVAGKGNTVRQVDAAGAATPLDVRVGYFVRIVARDGRYRYEITNLESAIVETFRSADNYIGSAEAWLAGFRANTSGSNRRLIAGTLSEILGTATDLEASIKKGMAKPSSGKNDW